jgi:TolB protein
MKNLVKLISILGLVVFTLANCTGTGPFGFNVDSDGNPIESGATGVSTGQNFNVNFPGGVDPDSVNADNLYLILLGLNSRGFDSDICDPANAIDAEITIIDAQNVTLNPVEDLACGTQYAICLTQDLAALNGFPTGGDTIIFDTEECTDTGCNLIPFVSHASNFSDLVLGCKAASCTPNQLYVRNTDTNETILVSVGDTANIPGRSAQVIHEAQPANSDVTNPRISRNCRYVTYQSAATNLSLIANESRQQIYRTELETGETKLVSVGFYDPGRGILTHEEADADAIRPSISDDGRYIAFTSTALNILPTGDPGFHPEKTADSLGHSRIFLRDMEGTAVIASVDSSGDPMDDHAYEAEVSGNGAFVVFWSLFLEIPVKLGRKTTAKETGGFIYRYSRLNDISELVSIIEDRANARNFPEAAAIEPAVSQDGSIISWTDFGPFLAGDTNGDRDIYVKNMNTLDVVRASVDSAENEGCNTRFAPRTPSVCGGSAWNSSVSADGRYIGFVSSFDSLIENGDPSNDAYRRDLLEGTTILASPVLATRETKRGANIGDARLSGNDRWMLFETVNANVLPNKNPASNIEVYFYDFESGLNDIASITTNGDAGNSSSYLYNAD